jgi:hypothetical protein
MKKTILIAVVIVLGWAGFSYFSAAWNREQFIREVDSFLESPRELSESNLVPLILRKATQSGIELRPEDIQVRIESADRETTTSKLLENKGFKADVRTLNLHVKYRQSYLGASRTHILIRERTFTSGITPSTQPPADTPILPQD